MTEQQTLQGREQTDQHAKNENDWLAFISSVSSNFGSPQTQNLPNLTNALSGSSTSPPLPSLPSLGSSSSSQNPSPFQPSFNIGSYPSGSSSSSLAFNDSSSNGSTRPQDSSGPPNQQHAIHQPLHSIAFPPVYDPSLHLQYPVSSQHNNASTGLVSASVNDSFHSFFPPATAFTPPPFPPTFHQPQQHSPIPSLHQIPQFLPHQPQPTFHIPASFNFNSPDPTPSSSTSTSPIDAPRIPLPPPLAYTRRTKSVSTASKTASTSATRPARGRSNSSAAGPSRARESRSSSSTASIQEIEPNERSGTGGGEGGEGGEIDDVEEDKRRRNTEASARFRAKKKAKAINLSRTVSDLSGRVQELEVEAGELRSENKWLKQLVLTKAQGNAQSGA